MIMIKVKPITYTIRVGFAPSSPKAPPAPEPPPEPDKEDPEVQKAITEWRRRRAVGSSRSTTLLTGGSGVGGFSDKKRLLGE